MVTRKSTRVLLYKLNCLLNFGLKADAKPCSLPFVVGYCLLQLCFSILVKNNWYHEYCSRNSANT